MHEYTSCSISAISVRVVVVGVKLVNFCKRLIDVLYCFRKVLQKVFVGVIICADVQVFEVRKSVLEQWIVVDDGQYMRYAGCAYQVGLVERVQATNVKLPSPWDLVDPAHTSV